ncbi:MAG TPA: type II secretion system protein [Candidatus Saccharimonadales bacterium]|nr:type II secretion system protein [Candidatus Saccharimonadales bacterium]
MKTTAQQNNQKGFTLIELLVVIGILAVLMGIVLVAINPSRQFNQANDARRANDARQLLNAIGAYAADNKGTLPAGLTTPLAITEIGDGTGQANICSTLVPTYISALPEDPKINNGQAITTCTTYDSGYQVTVDAQGRVTITAPNAAYGPISVTR